MRLLIAVLFVSCLVGCATVTSTNISVKNEGISYYLPKRLHKVSVSVTNLNEDATKLSKAEEAYAKALVAKDAATKDFADKKKVYEAFEQDVKDTPEGKAKQKKIAKRDDALVEFNRSKTALGEASAAVTSAYETLKKITAPTTGGDGCNYQVKLAIEPQPLMPDDKLGFVAKLHHNIFHSDEFKIATTESGLLSSTESKSTDNTGDVIGKIVQTLASFGVPVPGLSPQGFQMEKEVTPSGTCEPVEVSATVDLSDPDDVSRLNITLGEAKLGLEVCGKGIVHAKSEKCLENPQSIDELKFDTQKSNKKPDNHDQQGASEASIIQDQQGASEASIIQDQQGRTGDTETKDQEGSNKAQNKEEVFDGLLYRRELPYVVRLWDFNSETIKAVRVDALVMMPNLSPITTVKFDPAYFVTNTQKVGFNNGMLVSLETVRPSEALGFVSIPAEIVKTYLSTVTQVIKLKVDYTNNQADLAKSESALIDAIKNLNDKKTSQAAGE